MKKKFKRIISAALACALLLALLPASALAATEGAHWADEYVQAAEEKGWIDAGANVDKALTRGEFAVILWKALGSPAALDDCPFTDVSMGEIKTAVTALYNAGVVEGTSGTAFDPDSNLIRQDGITMLARAFEMKASNANAAAGYADWSSVDTWAQDAMAAMVEDGIVIGVGLNRLAPKKNITLAEMVKIVSVAEAETDCAIVSVKTSGFVDTDGAKTSTIIVEYDRDMTGADVSAAAYEVYNYGVAQGDKACEIGSDPGKVTDVYAKGNCVYIEINTEYQLGSVCKKYSAAMAASVKQVADITTKTGTVAASVKTVGNYEYQVVENVKPSGDISYNEWYLAKDGTYTIENIAEFKLFTKEDGTAYHATNCFEEATGEYVDVDLPYALYVPADYNPNKEYALVIQIEDAGFLGDDPMITLTESQACANFASAEVQQIVKDEHGLAGIIVVSPQISEALRSTRDNWSMSAAVPATWQLLDSLTEKYSISMDHIYGTGQSMGGMQIVAMAAQRDNYFAGIWANGCQWGSNYDLEDGYNGAAYYESPVDGVYITGVDADGNPVDYRNWYYMLSDDNVLITNCAGDKFSTQTWRELDYLYHDLAGTDLIYENYLAIWNPLTATKEEQNALAEAAMEKAAKSDLGYVWTAFEGGNHMATWIYSHGVKAHYEWLLSQTQDTIEARGKLECLKNNFEYAEVQDTSAARELAPDAATGEMVYFATGKLGAGTADYNGCWLKMGNSVLKAPNWKADPGIVSVETLGFVDIDGSKTSAIVVEYNVDMTGADIDLDDYEIEDYGTTLTAGDLNTGSDPGKPLKIYVNNEPAISATGGSGTGRYVIIEVNTDFTVGRFARSWKITMAAGVKQVNEIKTDKYTIAPSAEAVTNYEQEVYIGFNPMTGQPRDPEYYNYAIDGTYTIEGIEDYELHTIETGTAFKATHCFDEANGQYWDFDLPYALYVPDDYDPSKEYALVLHIHDAGSMSSDPRLTLTEAQGPSNYASEEFQQLAKDQGLGGAIVVCPAIEEFFYMDAENSEYELRMARDNWTLSCGCPAIWQLMDSITETYSIDMNRIYGSGQSMGGMTVMAMAAQRDNYFAAILPMSCQWGQNFNKEYEFNGTVYYNAPSGDGELIWDKDVDGNPVDFNNWYYLCSDDNILFLWTEEVPEFMLLYSDLCGVEVESANMYLDTETNMTDEERSALISELVNRESDLGMYYVYLSGTVGHMSAWFYGHGTTAVYEWMLSQTRESEMAREKLDLNKPFVLASEQLQDEAHTYSVDNKTGEVTYYPTGEFGSGTIGYNSACSALGSQEKLNPGWTPEN